MIFVLQLAIEKAQQREGRNKAGKWDPVYDARLLLVSGTPRTYSSRPGFNSLGPNLAFNFLGFFCFLFFVSFFCQN
jgi:hypothetical protein